MTEKEFALYEASDLATQDKLTTLRVVCHEANTSENDDETNYVTVFDLIDLDFAVTQDEIETLRALEINQSVTFIEHDCESMSDTFTRI